MNSKLAQPAFLGFSSMSDLIDLVVDQAGAGHPPILYLTALADTVPLLGSSLGTTTESVTAQAVLDGGVIGFCRVVVGHVQTLGGQPCDPRDAERVDRRKESLHAIVARAAERRGLTVRRATFAAPRDYVFLRGDPGTLATYDREADTYRATDA